jgi:hypothetical protein
MKLVKPASVVKATIQLGYPENVILGIGVVLLVCVVLYVIPKTSILDAILLTGYLGGAIDSRARGQSTILSYALPGLYCPADLGRALLARGPTACTYSFAALAVDVNAAMRPSGKIMTYSPENARLVEDGYASQE